MGLAYGLQPPLVTPESVVNGSAAVHLDVHEVALTKGLDGNMNVLVLALCLAGNLWGNGKMTFFDLEVHHNDGSSFCMKGWFEGGSP